MNMTKVEIEMNIKDKNHSEYNKAMQLCNS